MKVKLHTIVNPATIKALETLSTESIVPRDKVWPLAKTLSKIKSEVEEWGKVRISLFKKYGVAKGDAIEIIPAQLQAFNSDIDVVLNNEVELPLSDPIEIPTSLPDDSKLTAQDLLVLEATGIIKEKV